MTIERLKALHSARPFKPFLIRLADGKTIPVRHPEFLAQSPSGRTIVVSGPNDSAFHIDLFLVTALELLGERPRRSGRRA